jgi:hypothetical protein
MTTVERKDFKLSQGVKTVLVYVIRHHQTLLPTLQEAFRQNPKSVLDVTDHIRIPTTKPLYIHYEASNWLEGGVIKYRVERIVFYDNADQYNKSVNKIYLSKN